MYDFLNTVSGGTMFEEELANAIKNREAAEASAKQVEEANQAEKDAYANRVKQREEAVKAIDIEKENAINKYQTEEAQEKAKLVEQRKQEKLAVESKKVVKEEVKEKQEISEETKKAIKASKDFNSKLTSLSGLTKQSLYNEVQSKNNEQSKKDEDNLKNQKQKTIEEPKTIEAKPVEVDKKVLDSVNNTLSLGIPKDPTFISNSINSELEKIKQPTIDPIKADVQPKINKAIIEPNDEKLIGKPISTNIVNEPKTNRPLIQEKNATKSDSEQTKEKTLEQIMSELNDNLNKLIILNTDSNSINTKQLDLIDSLVAVNTQAHDYYVSRTSGNLGILKFGQMNTNPKGSQLAQI
jgi:myosin heavy subunit